MPHSAINPTIVIPVYNEEECISEAVTSRGDYLNEYLQGIGFNIILIDDGSKDNTPAILNKLSGQLSYLDVVHQKNVGRGNAVPNGYTKALSCNYAWVLHTS